MPLRREGAYPASCVAEDVYGFDPLSGDELEGYLADARALASIVGFPGVEDVEMGAPRATRWYVSDPTSLDYGAELPPDAVANPNVFLGKG